jgi:hypothetical protein
MHWQFIGELAPLCYATDPKCRWLVSITGFVVVWFWSPCENSCNAACIHGKQSFNLSKAIACHISRWLLVTFGLATTETALHSSAIGELRFQLYSGLRGCQLYPLAFSEVHLLSPSLLSLHLSHSMVSGASSTFTASLDTFTCLAGKECIRSCYKLWINSPEHCLVVCWNLVNLWQNSRGHGFNTCLGLVFGSGSFWTSVRGPLGMYSQHSLSSLTTLRHLWPSTFLPLSIADLDNHHQQCMNTSLLR